MCEPGAATAAQEDPLPTLTNLRPSVPIYKLPSAEVDRVKRGSTMDSTRRIQRITGALSELADMLHTVGEEELGGWARDCLGLVGRGDAHGLRRVRGAFGGMGSFNDLVLHPMNGHRIAPDEVSALNERLDVLRGRLHEDVTAILRELDA